MKKLYTMLAAAAAVSFGANAQDLTPVEVELTNPSFEVLPDGVTGNHNEIPTGWQVSGAAWYNEDGTASNLAAFQARNKSFTDGNYGMRSASDITLEPGTYMFQELMGQKIGTYVLQFDGMISRNSWQQGFEADPAAEYAGIEGGYGFAFVCDDMGDIDEPGSTEEPAEGLSAVFTRGQGSGAGNKWFSLYRYYVVHTTDAELDEEPETGIKFGFGIPTTSVEISKGRLACDNFHLLYFDTKDTEAVKAYVNGQINDLKDGKFAADADGNPLAWTVVNPSGNVTLTLAGVVTNSGYETEGINDITVAPEFVGNNKYYNLQGIEVADPTQPGLYIHNGKKILVK